eukprot:870640-Rhodomonas_salina.2
MSIPVPRSAMRRISSSNTAKHTLRCTISVPCCGHPSTAQRIAHTLALYRAPHSMDEFFQY